MAVSSAAEKTQSDLAHLIHPLYHPSDHQKPRIWVEGKGSILKDIDGVEVIDGLSGLWNVNIGHGRRELAEAAMDQMNTLAYCSTYTGASNLPAIDLAERLVSSSILRRAVSARGSSDVCLPPGNSHKPPSI